MGLRKLSAAFAAVALPLAAFGFTDVAAQTIRHEVGGQAATYDFKQAGQAAASSPGQPTSRAPRQPRATTLPRGPGNIPWDEPGKISGVPGVLDNPATNLPSARAVRAKSSSGARRARAEARSAPPQDQNQDGAPPPAEASPRGAEPVVDAQLGLNRAGEPSSPSPMQSPRREALQTQAPLGDGAKVQGTEAEGRARIIAEVRAKALLEEQRRLELERSKDRHARRIEPQPAVAPSGPAVTDPAVTGAIPVSRQTSSPDPAGRAGEAQPGKMPALAQADGATPAPSTSSWKDSICRILFFDALPGC